MKWRFSYMKLEFHMWKGNFTYEISVSYVKFSFSHIKFPYMKSKSYMKF
jgi:hypothetical protein